MGNATSIFNLMRNIGGSIGIALMTTFLARRSQVHQNHLVANVTAGSPQTLRMLQGMRANFIAHGADGVTASRKALGAVYGMVQQHAAMLAFVEAFFVMGVVFLLMLPFLPLLQYSKALQVPKAVPEPQKAVAMPDIPQDWHGALDDHAHDDHSRDHHAPEEEHDLVLH